MKSFIGRAVAYLKPQLPPDVRIDVEPHEHERPVLRPYADGLLVAYVVDQGGHYEYVQQRHLDETHVHPDDLHQLGVDNLTRLMKERPTNVQPHGHCFAVLMGGDFEASLLLVDGLWENAFRRFFRGEYLAAVPARDVLAFCDRGSAAGRAELTEIIARLWPAGDHLLSERLYTRRGLTWAAETTI